MSVKLLLAFGLCVPAFGNYSFVRQITVQHTKVGAIGNTDQTSFPVLFDPLRADILATSITSNATTTVALTTGGFIQNGDYIQLNSEIMLVGSGGGSASLTVTRAQLGTSAANHTAGINVADTQFLATVANNGNLTNSSGFDMIVSTSNTCAVTMNFQRVFYAASTGQTEIWWNNGATLSHSANTSVFLCYGNSSVTTDQQNAAAVWPSQYQAVYHFQDAGFPLTDSTSNGNNGASIASGGCVTTSAQSIINQSWQQAGLSINCGISMGSMTTVFNGVNSIFSWSGWLYSTDQVQGDNGVYNAGVANWTGPILRQNFGPIGDPQPIEMLYCTPSVCPNSVEVLGVQGTINTGQWYYLSETLNLATPSASKIFVNGLAVSISTNVSGTPATTFTAVTPGVNQPTLMRSNFNTGWLGAQDEVHLAITTPSADWVNTEYNNQNSPSTFYTLSAATSPPAGGGAFMIQN